MTSWHAMRSRFGVELVLHDILFRTACCRIVARRRWTTGSPPPPTAPKLARAADEHTYTYLPGLSIAVYRLPSSRISPPTYRQFYHPLSGRAFWVAGGRFSSDAATPWTLGSLVRMARLPRAAAVRRWFAAALWDDGRTRFYATIRKMTRAFACAQPISCCRAYDATRRNFISCILAAFSVDHSYHRRRHIVYPTRTVSPSPTSTGDDHLSLLPHVSFCRAYLNVGSNKRSARAW